VENKVYYKLKGEESKENPADVDKSEESKKEN
jgi:hypothetical protein